MDGWAGGEFARCEVHGWSDAGVEVDGSLNFSHTEFAGIMVWSSGVESKVSCEALVWILGMNADGEMP